MIRSIFFCQKKYNKEKFPASDELVARQLQVLEGGHVADPGRKIAIKPVVWQVDESRGAKPLDGVRKWSIKNVATQI